MSNENSNFLTLLRKYIGNAELLDIKQLGYDRILKFVFSKLNELGEIKKYYLYFEIMGKHSNVFLVDEDEKIISLLKKFSLEENSLRILFPGSPYTQPILEEKYQPDTITEDEFNALLKDDKDFTKIEGIGRKTKEALNSYEDLKTILNIDITPKIYFKDKMPIFATVLNLQAKNYDEVIEYSSFTEMVNTYIRTKSLSNSFTLLKNRLVASVEKEIKKSKKIIKNIKKDIAIMTEHEKYKNLGDVLASVLYSIKKGDTSVKAYDFYENKEITIELDPLLNPQGNLNKIYKKSSKMKRGLEINKERNILFNQRIAYLESVLTFIDNSENVDELKNIEAELIQEKIIKAKNNKKNGNKKKKVDNYGVMNIDGIDVFYGRNNKENDYLTFKFAKKDDIWFHVKDIPGSHFIVKKEDFSDELVHKVAICAAFYSKATKGDKVVVEYTEKKNLNKPKGAPLGFVTYNIAETIIVQVPEKL